MVPFTFILVFEGAVVAARWTARHRPAWTEEGAIRLFLVASVASIVFTAVAFTALAIPSWNADRDGMLSAGAALDRAGAPSTDLVMSADPAGIEYLTARGGVVTPNDSLDVIREVAADYQIRWLVLERAHIVEPLVPVIESKSRPAWLGAPIYSIPYSGPKSGDAASDNAPTLVIYPVCTQVGDTRCGSFSGTGTAP